MMIATSVIMYTQNYVVNKGKLQRLLIMLSFRIYAVSYLNDAVTLSGPKVQAGRQEQKKALEEYYANHGITPHH